MFNIASEETYEDGQIIFKEGSSGGWVCVVISGAVEISKSVGGKKVILGIIRPNEVFGEHGFIGNVKRSTTARAIGKTTIGVIDRTSLDQEFNSLSSEFRFILVSMVQRFEKVLKRATDFRSRKGERVQKTLSLNFKTPQAFASAFTSNLGTAGLFIKTEDPLSQGERFLLKMQHPGLTMPIQVECEVVWTRRKGTSPETGQPGMGVKFLEMTEKERQALKKYLTDIMKAPGKS